MSTTTIRLEEALKARIAAAAERAGKTPHAFLVDAIEQTVERAEREAEFHRQAEARWARAMETGETVAWADARDWLAARARGEAAPRPVARRSATGPGAAGRHRR